MPLPADVKLVRVTMGPFRDFKGQVATGTITFAPSASVLHIPSGSYILNAPVVVALDSNGAAEVLLPATDQLDIAPRHFVYRVTYALRIGTTQVLLPGMSIALVQDTPVVDLDLLAPVSAGGDLIVNLGGWVRSINGNLPTVTGAVTLDTQNLGLDPAIDAKIQQHLFVRTVGWDEETQMPYYDVLGADAGEHAGIELENGDPVLIIQTEA